MKKLLIIASLLVVFNVNATGLTGFSLKNISININDEDNAIGSDMENRIKREANITMRSLSNDYKYQEQENFINININVVRSNFAKHRFFLTLQTQEKTELTGRLERPTHYVISNQYGKVLITRRQSDVYATIIDMLLTFSEDYLKQNTK